MGAYLSYLLRRSQENIGFRQIKDGDRSEQRLRHTVVGTTDQLEKENRRLKEENLAVCQQVLRLELELEEKIQRLSANLSTQLSADERHLENIGETVRPSSLGKRYQQLESTKWVSAKEQIDDNSSIPSHDALRLLCFLMDVAYNAARPEVTRREAQIRDLLLSPVQSQTPSSTYTNDTTEPQCTERLVPPMISQTMKNEILKCMKKTSHLIDLSGLEDSVKVKAAETFTLPEGFFDSHGETQKYLKACCRLAWQFHLVQPPMVVSTEPTDYDKGIHNLWYDCDYDTNSCIIMKVEGSLLKEG